MKPFLSNVFTVATKVICSNKILCYIGKEPISSQITFNVKKNSEEIKKEKKKKDLLTVNSTLFYISLNNITFFI